MQCQISIPCHFFFFDNFQVTYLAGVQWMSQTFQTFQMLEKVTGESITAISFPTRDSNGLENLLLSKKRISFCFQY